MSLQQTTLGAAGAWLLTAGLAFALQQAEGERRRPDPKDIPTIGPHDLVIDGAPVKVIIPPDRIASIDEPVLLSVSEADAVYRDDEPIMGVVVAGEARAYSTWHLDRHEIVNDQLGGRALAATW